MKTFIELNIEPCVGMIVQAIKGDRLQHIIHIGKKREWHNTNQIRLVNDKGNGSWVEYNWFLKNYSFVGYSDYKFNDLFIPNNKSFDKDNEIKKLIGKIEEILR